MNRHHVHHHHGFTLIEMLVALVVLSIGMLGLSRMTVSTINVNALTRQLTVAAALAQDRMESLKQAGYAGATMVTSTEDYGAIPNYSAYKRVTTIKMDTPEAMKTVIVTVSWQSGKHTLNASTILAE